MRFDYEKTCLLKDSAILATAKKVMPEIKNLEEVLKDEYDTEYASINLPFDDQMLSEVTSVIKEKKKLKPSILVVIGIGGSNLGTIAVHNALHGEYYNDKEPTTKIYFPDTVDDDKMSDMVTIFEDALKSGENVLVNVVSKSGRTTETAALFEVFSGLLRKHKGAAYNKFIVATTDYESRLWELAEKKGYALLEIPQRVGGRYSVFSPVGLFPLGMMGLNIKELRQGAKDMIKNCVGHDVAKNPAAISAAITYNHIKAGRNINDMFIFSSDLRAIGAWYRQLMGESIGKEWNKNKTRQVHTGMTPTVSIGSTDLHSMAQMYLGGPQDRLTTFIRIRKNKTRVKLPTDNEPLIDNIDGKSLAEIMNAILEGVKIAFSEAKRPFVEISLPDKYEYCIAQLLQFKMIEMIYLAYLLDVNAFDQPNVEAYKKETRRILSEK